MFVNRYRNQILIALCVYLGQMLCGYDISWTAPIIPKLNDPEQSPLPRPPTSFEASFMASIIYVAGLPSVLSMSWFSNYKGRKPGLILAASFSTVGFFLLALSTNFIMVFIGRFIATFGVGSACLVNMIYIGEIASTKIRGILLTGIGIIQSLGSLLVYSAGPYVSYSSVSYIAVGISIIYFIAVIFIPESPVFYAIKDEDKKMITVLNQLQRQHEINGIIELKKAQIKTNDLEDWRELFTIKCNRKGLIITTVISSLNYLSGVLVVSFFTTSIFEMAGSSIKPEIATIIIGCTQLFGSTLAPCFVERSGRRSLLLVSTALSCLSMIIFGTYFYLLHIEHSVILYIKWLPLAVLVLFFLSNNMGFGVIPSTLTGEMFRPNVRSKGTAIVISVSWVFGFTVATIFNSIATQLGAYIMFWFFSSTCGMAFLFTFFCIPETKGKSLVEIQEMLSK
ncbi:facilitated trehalose transporter Tret1-like [Colias croceus]|uniref:facilitated trehalose transporter Tret1-like n=1 Tax=Colias crocea TaxID=72248 RepID=UPI001E27DBEB|nr:facilitated trehalose transporter Tret1-like [Colias croceus]